jgi:exopolysaccharide biosynthesis predicted pyruvyltransferase EpsI/coenzyme F420-reducing hydrogenase beta subunit
MTPEEICNQKECTGCSACMNVCPHNAITMTGDEEGFIHPFIDAEKCVDCKLCQKTCPITVSPKLNTPLKVYSGWSLDKTIRLGSSSGGAFSEIARPVLESGGVVFGCGLDENLQAVHMYVEDMEALRTKLSGSKYVQSRIGDSYQKAKSFLKEGRKVLFSGTPCQIAGLRNYLHRDYPNLFTVDIICHGVPSPMIFEDYKKYMSEKHQMLINDVKFRCKKSSWIFFNMTLTGHVEKSNAKKTYEGAYYEDPYIRGFLRDNFLRPSCYGCKFTSVERTSDFTIADWWGYRKQSQQDNGFRYKGVSLMLANTDKALGLVSFFKMSLRERTLEEAKRTNICLSHPFPMPASRGTFWKDYKALSFDEIVRKYFYPENVDWKTKILQHHKNSDCLVTILNVLYFPIRVKNKAIKVSLKAMKIFKKIIKKVMDLPDWLYLHKERKALMDQLSQPSISKRIFLFCAPTHSNLGDQAQLMCWIRLFQEWYPNYTLIKVPTKYRRFETLRTIHKVIKSDDKIFIHSGYLIFDPHPELPFILDIVRDFYDHHITILPQTVNLMDGWYQHIVSGIFNSHSDLTLMCRDEVSLKKAEAMFPNVKLKLMPDVVTSLIGNDQFQYANSRRKGALLCVRNDLEKYYTDNQINSLRQKLDDLMGGVQHYAIPA